MSRPGPRVVIACAVMRPELEAVDTTGHEVELRFLDQNLHRTPDLLRDHLQAAVERAAPRARQIVVGYGLCANGSAGLTAPGTGLVIPRVHDCIGLFLGSRDAYERAFRERAGTYYLTAGWIGLDRDPLGTLEREYIPRMGREDAVWGLREELKHYTHIVLIDTGVGDLAALRERARENARFLDKTYLEVRGSGEYFRRLLLGPYDDEAFLRVGPGEGVTQDEFF